MANSELALITGALVEIAHGFHPLPDGYMFECVLSGESVAVKAKLVGNKLEIEELKDDAHCYWNEGDSGQAADSDDTSGDYSIFILCEPPTV